MTRLENVIEEVKTAHTGAYRPWIFDENGNIREDVLVGDVLPLLEDAGSFDNDTLFNILKNYAAKKEYKVNTVMWPLRTAVSGKPATPAGATGLMEVLGRDETIARIQAAIRKLG